MSVLSIRHACPHPAGFSVRRPDGHPAYTFLHFINPVKLGVRGVTVMSEPHACIFYSPGEPQYFLSELPLVHDWMHFSPDSRFLPSMFQIEENRIFYPTSPENITALFRELENEWFGTRSFRAQALENGMERFFILFSRAIHEARNSSLSVDASGMLMRVRSEVLLHPEKAWCVEDMAVLAQMSLSHFYAGYKQTFGTSPMNDLIEARISAAKNKLLADNTPISLLAEQLGYNNPYHFIRQFREHTGQTPAEYRRHPEVYVTKNREKMKKTLDR